MEKSTRLIKVFTGPEASAILLKSRLDVAGIPALIKNDSSMAYFGTSPNIVDLYIEEDSIPEAEPLIRDFIQ
jgi:hypothetical protein